jgi:methylated-DNA-protein-cysteine methyltransferase-like protein
MLTGKIHFDTPEQMETLLRNEGITVENDKISNFNDLFWNPSIELEID